MGWRGLWDYLTAAPPRTAVHHAINKGWTVDTDLAAAQLYEQQKLGWRYTTVHFERGADVPFPEPILRPGVHIDTEPEPDGPTNWADVDAITDLIPAHVRDLLKGA